MSQNKQINKYSTRSYVSTFLRSFLSLPVRVYECVEINLTVVDYVIVVFSAFTSLVSLSVWVSLMCSGFAFTHRTPNWLLNEIIEWHINLNSLTFDVGRSKQINQSITLHFICVNIPYSLWERLFGRTFVDFEYEKNDKELESLLLCRFWMFFIRFFEQFFVVFFTAHQLCSNHLFNTWPLEHADNRVK